MARVTNMAKKTVEQRIKDLEARVAKLEKVMLSTAGPLSRAALGADPYPEGLPLAEAKEVADESWKKRKPKK